MDSSRILDARAAIGKHTPLVQDCGLLCGAACCDSDDDGHGGVALLPGEAELLREADWGHLEYDEVMDAPMLICDGSCKREARPLLCRIFPLCPVKGKDGSWTLRMDARARPICPLTRCGVRGLDPEFVRGVMRAVRLISADHEGEAFLLRWAEIEAQFRKPFL